ncbi:nucleic acid-binding, OB-fold protein [Tanacetum coccineum]|uniref:Nucleic acid-binding, OB-fold protein n=1 Tax=Tanacetum coccineum TaxID=301880 RepID=A0ABQ5F2M5_9ASTR
MQAQVRMKLVNQFKDCLKEGSDVTLEGYSLGEIQPKFRMVNKPLRLSFLSSTKVEPCTDFSASFYGFDFRGYKSITDLQQEEDDQFDVIGHVIACEDLDMYDKNGKSGKKKPLTLVDHELFAREDVEKSENTSTRISMASKNSTKETFVGVTYVIVGTIIAIHEEEVFTVLRLSDDPEILDSIRLAVTPSKDLESQTDENMTHVSTQKKNVVDHVEQQDASDGKNKCAAENDIGNESSNGKKRAIEVKTEKALIVPGGCGALESMRMGWPVLCSRRYYDIQTSGAERRRNLISSILLSESFRMQIGRIGNKYGPLVISRYYSRNMCGYRNVRS